MTTNHERAVKWIDDYHNNNDQPLDELLDEAEQRGRDEQVVSTWSKELSGVRTRAIEECIAHLRQYDKMSGHPDALRSIEWLRELLDETKVDN